MAWNYNTAGVHKRQKLIEKSNTTKQNQKTAVPPHAFRKKDDLHVSQSGQYYRTPIGGSSMTDVLSYH